MEKLLILSEDSKKPKIDIPKKTIKEKKIKKINNSTTELMLLKAMQKIASATNESLRIVKNQKDK